MSILSEKLEPCPHCGKPAEPVYEKPLQHEAYIMCSDHNCLCSMHIYWGTKDNKKVFIQRLIDNWNRRSNQQQDSSITLPCKNGDAVYRYCNGKIHKGTVTAVAVAFNGQICISYKMPTCYRNERTGIINKTVFLSQKAAEQALEGTQNE